MELTLLGTLPYIVPVLLALGVVLLVTRSGRQRDSEPINHSELVKRMKKLP